jgi:hypothetical protein
MYWSTSPWDLVALALLTHDRNESSSEEAARTQISTSDVQQAERQDEAGQRAQTRRQRVREQFASEHVRWARARRMREAL